MNADAERQDGGQDATTAPRGRALRLVLVLVPLVAFLALALLFYSRLGSDASRVPSPMIGRQVPQFTLPALAGAGVPGFSTADLRQGRVSIVNVFASWCVPCRDEHPLLLSLARDETLKAAGVRIIGLNYKDKPAQALGFLRDLGIPYAMIGADEGGRAAIDWGVYGVPETFVVKGDGTIAYKFIGPLNARAMRDTLIPQIVKALEKPAAK